MINELPPREEMEMLCLTIRQHNCVKAVKGSVFSLSLFHWLALLLKKSWYVGKRAEADFHTRKTYDQCTIKVSLPGAYGRKWSLMVFSALFPIRSLQ